MDIRIIAFVVEIINNTGQTIKFRRRVHCRELDHPERYITELTDVRPGSTDTVDKGEIFDLFEKLGSHWELDVYIGNKLTGMRLDFSHFEHYSRLVFEYDENQPGENVICLDVVEEDKKNRLWGLRCFRITFGKWGNRPRTRIYPTPVPAPAPAPGDNDDLSRLNSNNDDRQGETDDGHPSSSASASASADEILTSESMPHNSQRFSSFADASITKSESMARGSQHFSSSADATRANCESMERGTQQFSLAADATTGNWPYPSSEAEETSHDQKVTKEIEMCSVIPPTNMNEHGTEFQFRTVSKDDPSNSLLTKEVWRAGNGLDHWMCTKAM